MTARTSTPTPPLTLALYEAYAAGARALRDADAEFDANGEAALVANAVANAAELNATPERTAASGEDPAAAKAQASMARSTADGAEHARYASEIRLRTARAAMPGLRQAAVAHVITVARERQIALLQAKVAAAAQLATAHRAESELGDALHAALAGDDQRPVDGPGLYGARMPYIPVRPEVFDEAVDAYRTHVAQVIADHAQPAAPAATAA